MRVFDNIDAEIVSVEQLLENSAVSLNVFCADGGLAELNAKIAQNFKKANYILICDLRCQVSAHLKVDVD
jgi:hypothetical protein